MKKMAHYTRKIRQLAARLRKERGKVSLPGVEDPMHQLMRGILSTYASEGRADAALAKLHASMVDLNELRVTPVADIVSVIGTDFPSCRLAAEELSRGLNAVFNKTHRLDLDFLKTMARKAAEGFLDSLDGVGAHAKATVMLRCLGAPVVPVDDYMLAFLRRDGCVPETAMAEDVQKLLTSRIPDREAGAFYVGLKRYAAAHAPRKADKPAPVAAETAKAAEGPAEAAATGKTAAVKKGEEKTPAGKAAAIKKGERQKPARSEQAKPAAAKPSAKKDAGKKR
jgi:endonuclease III